RRVCEPAPGRVTRNGGGDGREDGSLSPLWGARGVGLPGVGYSPRGGRGPYAAGWEGNSRGDKFRVLERGVEQDLITRGTGATQVVGWQPACGQAGAPPHAPARGTPLLSRSVTTTFTAPEGVRIF